MTYATIDDAINSWAKRHSLLLCTMARDDEVRSTDIVDKQGNKYQIWVDPPGIDGTAIVHAWDYKKRRFKATGTRGSLDSALEAAYQQVRQWSGQSEAR